MLNPQVCYIHSFLQCCKNQLVKIGLKWFEKFHVHCSKNSFEQLVSCREFFTSYHFHI